MVLIRIDIHGCVCVCVHCVDIELNLHGYQEGNKQHVAVLTSLSTFNLHATPVFYPICVFSWIQIVVIVIVVWHHSTVSTFPSNITCVTQASSSIKFVAGGSFILLTAILKY